MKMFRRDNHELVTVVLRFAVGASFLWFGVDKWIHPEAWLSYFPQWLLDINGDRYGWLRLGGGLEFVFGIFLVAGSKLRTVSAAAGLYLALVCVVLGANEVTVRDTAIIGGLLALFIEANAAARKPVPPEIVSKVCTFYVVFLFIYGVLFLRGGGGY